MMWPSADWGDSYEEGMRKLGIDIDAEYDDENDDDLFEDDEEKEEYIGQHMTRAGWYRCPTCELLWQEMEHAMSCHPEDVR